MNLNLIFAYAVKSDDSERIRSYGKPKQQLVKIQYPAYAVKSDDGEKDRKNQYPAYALKSDDGKNQNQYPAYALKSDDGKNQIQTRKQTELSNYPIAYAANTAIMAKN